MNEILLEYYAGKPKELIKCEGYLREIIKLVKKDHTSYNIIRQRQVYRDAPVCKKLEATLTDFFHVKGINIYWQSGTVNACTLSPTAVMIPEYKNNYLAGNQSNLTIHMCMYEDLIYQCDLNEQELLAIMLHEIGHNFYFCPVMFGFEFFYTAATLPFGLIAKFIAKAVIVSKLYIEDWLKKNIPIFKNLSDIWNDVWNNARSAVAPLDLAITIAKVAGGSARFISTDPVKAFFGYGGEKGADSFAAQYGYGPELISGLKKMEHPKEYLGTKLNTSMGPLGAVSADLYDLTIDCISAMTLNVHPNNNQRAQATLAKLKADYKKGEYPPALKRDLEFEIKRMEKMVDAVSKSSVEGDVNIKKAWYDMINTVTRGHSDFREIFNFYFDSFRF